MASTWPDAEQSAARLRSRFELPVDVVSVAAKLGVDIRYHDDLSRPEGFTEFGSTPAIYVRAAERPRLQESVRVRFTIAHELGHVVLYRDTGAKPTKEDYWRHEKWCHQFAAILLVPPQAISQYFPEVEDRSWLSYLFLPTKLAKAAKVSFEVSARALARLPGFGYHYLRLAVRKDRRIWVNVSTFGNERATGKGSVLASDELAAKLMGIEPGSTMRVTWNCRLGQLELGGRPSVVYRDVSNWIVVFPVATPHEIQDAQTQLPLF